MIFYGFSFLQEKSLPVETYDTAANSCTPYKLAS